MALAPIVDSLDSVPEAARGAYVADGDKFKLDVEFEDTSGLKSSLQKERDSRKALEKEVAGWKKLGKTPDEIATLTAAAEREAAEALKKAGNFDAILKQHTDKWGSERSALETRAASAESFAKSALVETSVMGALTKAKVTPEGVSLLTDVLGKRITLELGEDGSRKVQIMQADGKTPIAGKGAEGAATFDDLVAEAVKTWPSLFEGAGAGGGGTPPKGGKPGDKTITRADFEKLGPMDRAAKIKTHKVVD